MKVLDGKELAGFVKESQARRVRELESEKKFPKLLILRDNDDPVIAKYVSLKQRYGEDIGVEVEDFLARDSEELKERILAANEDDSTHGMIIQLPLRDAERTDELVALIAPEKDVDGLSGAGSYDSATATAINWLLGGYGVELMGKKIAVVGRGRLVGGPLARMWQDSGLEVRVFHRGDDLNELRDYEVVVSATGVPGLIRSEMIAPSAVVVDAGTASEGGVLVGDLDEKLREREDLAALTPVRGGVGPLTVAVLFEHVLNATK